MTKERRSHLRVSPTTIKANISSSLLADKDASLHAEILDISRSGIRIKLNEPLQTIANNKVKITMYLPDSGAPFSVNCILKNKHSETEYGLHYIENNKAQGSIDDMLFECVKLEESMFLIKSSSFNALSRKP